MSTSSKSNSSKNKFSFTYSPTQQDVDAYIKFKSGEIKQRAYMKDYRSLHHIDGLSDNSILVYEAIRNLMSVYCAQQKFKENYVNNKNDKGIGIVRKNKNKSTNSIVGTTMIVTNPMLQEWIGNKSHHTIKSSLEQLESMGFIKCTTDGVKKSGRKVTLLRDMEEYQPEEIEALEAVLKSLRDTNNMGNEEILTEEEKPKRKRSVKSENKKNEVNTDEVQNESDISKSDVSKSDEDELDELDDFDF